MTTIAGCCCVTAAIMTSGTCPAGSWSTVRRRGTAIREVREETGLEVEVSRLAGVYSKPEADDLVFSFLCRRVGGEIALSDEADRIEFFRADELPPNTIPKQVERITDSVRNTETVVCRIQRGASSIQLSKAGKL